MTKPNSALASLLISVGVATLAGCAQRGADSQIHAEQISEILGAQVDAWNAGDIDQFMIPYWRSERLTFSSGGQTKRGWETTRDGYKQRYPTRERMGRLDFSEIEVTPLGDNAALVLGRWRLTRDRDSVGGVFSLVWKRIAGQWKIIHDHTSVSEPDQTPPSE